MTSPNVLRTAPEYPERQRPDHVQRVHRPDFLLKARQLAFLIFERHDLDAAERFWTDFGLFTVSRTEHRLVMRAAGTSPAVLIATKAKRFPTTISLQDWHTLVVRTKGNELSVSIDGKSVGTFASEGITHATKSLVSLTTNPVDVHYDDFSLKGTGAAPVAAKK